MRFKIGDIAIGVCPEGRPDRYGHHNIEARIVEPLRLRQMEDGIVPCYVVSVRGETFRARPEWLRPQGPLCNGLLAFSDSGGGNET